VKRLPKLARDNLSEDVYEVIRKRILDSEFLPGQRLDLSDIERQMGISRTPLKEALGRLALEGLVEIQSRRGTYVTAPALGEIEDAFEVRRVLEVYAAGVAAQQATESQLREIRNVVAEMRQLMSVEDVVQMYRPLVERDLSLHRLIVRVAGNEQLEKLWEQVNVHVQMARVHYRSVKREFEQAQQEHEGILGALEVRDAVAVQRLMERHIERARQSLRSEMEALRGAQ